jgi:RNA polymerase sigma factor (sigma-70 family)
MVLPRREWQSFSRCFDASTLESLRFRRDAGNRLTASLVPIVRVFVRREAGERRIPTAHLDDLTQDVMLHAWQGLNDLRSTDARQFLAWLWRIAHNVTANFATHDRRQRGIEVDWSGTHRIRTTPELLVGNLSDLATRIPLFDDDPMKEVERRESSDAVAHAISQLPQRQRDTLLRWVIQGETIHAIAKRHGVSDRTSSRDVRDALRLLAQLLQRFRS